MAEQNRLSLVLERASEDVHEPEFVSDSPLVDFDAFAPGRRVFGWVRLDADRLTDLLNTHTELHLVNVLVEDLGDGATVTADEALIQRGELIAVRASGPRGSAARRQATVPPPVLVTAGRFLVGGHLHATPGADPMRRIRGLDTMIPLTDAWISYSSGGRTRHQRVGTLIVNRDLATSVERVSERALAEAEPVVTSIAG